jgi:hypothetical protein
MVLQFFVYLQLLDFITTMMGFRLGASEASPFIRMLTDLGPAVGVGLSKGIALALGAVCIWLKKDRIIGWINYWYAGLVVWNLCIIMRLLTTPGLVPAR